MKSRKRLKRDLYSLMHNLLSFYYTIRIRDGLIYDFAHLHISAYNASNLPIPIPMMINSTAISVTLPSTPYLAPKANWTYVRKHEILYHRSGIEETPKKLTVIGALPQTINATGLEAYTDYVFYAHYFGKINGEDQNIITSYSEVIKTDGDGMISSFEPLSNIFHSSPPPPPPPILASICYV